MVNASCTLYKWQNGRYIRYYIPDVYWHKNSVQNLDKSGVQNAGDTVIYIYGGAYPETLTRDMLVKGLCPFNFTATTEAELSAQLKTFKRAYKHVTVQAINDCQFGGLPHWEITAKD